jgi:hypothetical protein
VKFPDRVIRSLAGVLENFEFLERLLTQHPVDDLPDGYLKLLLPGDVELAFGNGTFIVLGRRVRHDRLVRARASSDAGGRDVLPGAGRRTSSQIYHDADGFGTSPTADRPPLRGADGFRRERVPRRVCPTTGSRSRDDPSCRVSSHTSGLAAKLPARDQ